MATEMFAGPFIIRPGPGVMAGYSSGRLKRHAASRRSHLRSDQTPAVMSDRREPGRPVATARYPLPGLLLARWVIESRTPRPAQTQARPTGVGQEAET
jgi:hypothetical protein